jgi:LysM repeat protein
VPALFGVAAAAVVANVPTGASAASVPGGHTDTNQTAAKLTANRGVDTTKTVRLVADTTPKGKHAKPAAAAPSKYTVKSGDTLSAIARSVYQDDRYWTAIYWANKHLIKYANTIQVGQVLTIPAKPATVPGAPSELSAPVAQVQHTVSSTASTVHQYASEQSAPVQTSTVSTSGNGGFQSCVISRESGGNSQVMNSSGHYGLYQFSASTWAAYGGNPSDFGNASVSEQKQVLNNAMARGGQSNWSAYDGC